MRKLGKREILAEESFRALEPSFAFCFKVQSPNRAFINNVVIYPLTDLGLNLDSKLADLGKKSVISENVKLVSPPLPTIFVPSYQIKN